MNTIKSKLIVSIIVISSLSSNDQFIDTNYPKDILQLFASRIVSNGLASRDMAISSGWREVYYTLQHNNGLLSTILTCKRVNGK